MSTCSRPSGRLLGPVDAILVFFLAPFLGLVGALFVAGWSALVKREVQIIPYGPYLAAAAVVVMIFHEPMLELLGFGIV